MPATEKYRIIREAVVGLPQIELRRHVRSTLAESIEDYWVGKASSNVGIPYLRFEEGIVKVVSTYARCDLLWLRDSEAKVSIFVTPSLPSGDPWVEIQGSGAKEISDAQRAFYTAAALLAVEQNRVYWAAEVRFLVEQPFTEIDGMTPEDAVAKLRELGW
jgi:hypothetical protein